MARLEKPVPRLARSGGIAPRKNLYFDGALQEEVLDYFIWRGNVEPYEMLDGTTACGSSDVIKDHLRRKYLADTLDESLLRRFSSWRRTQYLDARSTESGTPELPLRAQRAASGETLEMQARRQQFVIAAYGVSRHVRASIWDSQFGRCGSCNRDDVQLEVHCGGNDKAPLRLTYLALCSMCHRSEHGSLAQRGRPPNRQSIISCLKTKGSNLNV
jgi:hypothetical protein